ncbi:DUF1349 domain-containing protein [Streptomyces sp. NPDC091266]|uniref:DUF1349 domain-containing protein n=1 Tax=Streptomyces sp. NPDC091266 TaxID=3365978 RepID=UPI003814ADCB
MSSLPELPFPLTAHGPAAEWNYSAGTLSVTAAPGQDRFVRPGAPPDPATARDAPRLLGVPTGDFRLAAKVTADLSAPGDAGGLYVHGTDDHWAKLCLERSPLRPTVVSVVTRTVSDDANAFETPDSSYWLRVSRTGGAFAFHASPDGQRWTFVRLFSLDTPTGAADVRVGFMPQSPSGTGCRVRYAHLSFRAGAPGGLRDGS